MFEIDFTFIWVFINFIFLFIALRFLLFKRLGDFMRKRSEKISENIRNGELKYAEGEEYRKKYESQFENSITERQKIIEDAKKRAEAEAVKIIDEAKREAEKILKDKRAQADRERETMIKDMRKDIIELSILAASKVVEENMDSEGNRKIVESFLGKAEVR